MSWPTGDHEWPKTSTAYAPMLGWTTWRTSERYESATIRGSADAPSSARVEVPILPCRTTAIRFGAVVAVGGSAASRRRARSRGT